jgi:hypothetical protein
MDSFRSISVVSVAQLILVGAMGPALADEEEDSHRRQHHRGHAQTVSHSRADYPVIWNWIAAVDDTEPSQHPADKRDRVSVNSSPQ